MKEKYMDLLRQKMEEEERLRKEYDRIEGSIEKCISELDAAIGK